MVAFFLSGSLLKAHPKSCSKLTLFQAESYLFKLKTSSDMGAAKAMVHPESALKGVILAYDKWIPLVILFTIAKFSDC